MMISPSAFSCSSTTLGSSGLGSGNAVMHSMIEQFFNGTLVEQLFDGLLIQSLTYMAEGVGDLVIHPVYILDLEVVSSHCRHPPMSDGVQIGHHHDVGQRIVVGADEERLVLQILPKLISHGPLESQELQLRGVILQLTSLEATTGVGDRMVMVIVLFLGEHRVQSFYRGVCLKQEGLLKSSKHQHRRREALHLKLLKCHQGIRG